MKIGEYVTVQAIKDQCVARWVVLTDLKYTDYGDYEGVDGGIARCIANTKAEAGEFWADLNLSGVETLLVSGASESLCVGGVVFVE